MQATGQYDAELEMFREAPRQIDFNKLRFLRWLAERGQLEHEVFGPSSGALAPRTSALISPEPSD